MEGSSNALEAIQRRRHQASVYSAGHANVHLPDVVFFNIGDTPHVNSLPPLALDRTVFPCCTKKTAQSPAKPLNSLNDLAHTVDEKFVLAYPAGPPALVAPA
ncbi:hypothetical protein DSO57_1029493 [Entomophthora muscae]|uniref:Uncharacterized protein n=1 Tax=Entomophthora muscae TaxID=34485 RepID=A0ACC2UA61_9FUNG|nr:hypothetical protein DSO57_1029493 [Entomophthora muscae]